MQKIFDITNKYIILVTPLILYSLFSSIYIIISASNNRLINLIIALLLILLMTGAFLAGWCKMIKQAIIEPVREDCNSLIKEFPSGVGEYFLPSLCGLFIIFAFMTILIVASCFVGNITIGDPNIPAKALANAFQTPETLKAFLLTINPEQMLKLSQWNVLILSTLTLGYFSLMLYFPAIFFKNKNPLIAFYISLKDLFSKHILKTAGIILLIYIINLFISILSTLTVKLAAVHFIVTLANFYFITIASVGVFYYYNKTFVEKQIGQNVDIKI